METQTEPLATSHSSMKENLNILVWKLLSLDYGVVQHPTLIKMANGDIVIVSLILLDRVKILLLLSAMKNSE